MSLKHLNKIRLIKDNYKTFTEGGLRVQKLAINPTHGRIIVEGLKLGILDETLRVLAFWINKKSVIQCASFDKNTYIKKKEFCIKFAKYGDLIANLVVFEEYINKRI